MMPPAWEKWWGMAVDSLDAARLLERHGHLKSSASRGYYAAYQAMTAALLYQKQTPPEDREAWSHELTPELVRKQLTLIRSQDQRNDLAARLRRLYTIRIGADYQGQAETKAPAVAMALKDASYLVRTAGSILLR